jgi:hypothetical protein
MMTSERELTMVEIRHRIGITAPQDRVHQPGDPQISSWG